MPSWTSIPTKRMLHLAVGTWLAKIIHSCFINEDKLTGIVLCHRNLPCSMEMFIPLSCLCGNVFVCNCETVEHMGYGCDQKFYVSNNTQLFLYFIQKKPCLCMKNGLQVVQVITIEQPFVPMVLSGQIHYHSLEMI